MIQQVEIILRGRPRGFHLVTREISEQLPSLPQTGLLNLFVKHTSCALSIKENEPYYDHVLEGADDMPAHAKCSLTGVSLNIPISKGKLNLGTWQGIYLCEFRDYGGRRKLTATIIGE